MKVWRIQDPRFGILRKEIQADRDVFIGKPGLTTPAIVTGCSMLSEAVRRVEYRLLSSCSRVNKRMSRRGSGLPYNTSSRAIGEAPAPLRVYEGLGGGIFIVQKCRGAACLERCDEHAVDDGVKHEQNWPGHAWVGGSAAAAGHTFLECMRRGRGRCGASLSACGCGAGSPPRRRGAL